MLMKDYRRIALEQLEVDREEEASYAPEKQIQMLLDKLYNHLIRSTGCLPQRTIVAAARWGWPFQITLPEHLFHAARRPAKSALRPQNSY